MLVHTNNTYRTRAWVFTINNFTEGEKHNVELQIARAKYGIAEIEHQDAGTPHIQGYIYWENPKRFNEAKSLISLRAHIEPAKGNPKQNYDYCSKENTVFAKKPLPNNAGKDNFLEMWNDMQNLTIDEFMNKYPKEWYYHRDNVMRVMIDFQMKNISVYDGLLEEKNIWIYGEPGVGKSRWAASNGEQCETYKKNFNKWWDGYNLMTTKIVILEDYPTLPQGQALAQHLKIWGDRYPFTAECKGSHMLVDPGRFFFIITSNYPIDQCFENEEDREAIHRRFRERECKQGDFFNQCIFKLDRKYIKQ